MVYAETSQVVGVFDRREDAEAARRDLIDAGFDPTDIHISDEPGGQQTTGKSEGNFWDRVQQFFAADDVEVYGEVSRRGGIVLTVDARRDAKVDQASEIISHHDPIDIDKRASEYGIRRGTSETGRAKETTGESIPVTEEQLRVGTRREQRGGVRIYRHVTEQPVEEDVTLHDEKVHVERRKVDRPADAHAFEEKTIEMHETHEEPVVSKEARVVEEVTLRKDEETHTEKVHDTVRRTDVEIEQLGKEYRRDFDSRYATGGSTYESYRPAYELGRDLADEQRNFGRPWEAVEPEAKARFQQENRGDWSSMRDAVRYGYEQSRR